MLRKLTNWITFCILKTQTEGSRHPVSLIKTSEASFLIAIQMLIFTILFLSGVSCFLFGMYTLISIGLMVGGFFVVGYSLFSARLVFSVGGALRAREINGFIWLSSVVKFAFLLLLFFLLKDLGSMFFLGFLLGLFLTQVGPFFILPFRTVVGTN